MARSKNLALGVILSSATLTIMAGSIIAPTLNLMRENLGVSPSEVGIIITTHGLFMALFSPLMGIIIDRMGARRPYIIALICYGLAGGSGLVIQSFHMLLVSRAFLGIALAGIFTAINVLILDMYAGRQRNQVMGWRGSAQSVGGILWPLIGGALGGLSWHLPFAVYLLAVPIGCMAIAAVPEAQAAPPVQPNDGNAVSVFRLFRQTPVLLVILALTFFGSVLLYAIIIFLPQLLEKFGIHSTFKIGSFIAAMTFSAGVVSFFYAMIRSRFAYRPIVMAAVALWAAAFICLAWATGPVPAVAAVALFGIAQGLIMPTVMVWIGDAVPIAFRGRFSSYLGTAGFIGQFLSPVLFAPVMILGGFRSVFLISALIGIIWFLLIFFVLRRTMGHHPVISPDTDRN